MGDAEVRSVFREVALSLPSLVAEIDDFAVPALGSWNAGALHASV